jgi:release factor glutamine methyltransferase
MSPATAVAEVTRELAAAGCVSAAAEARWLVEEAADPEKLRAMVARRVAGEPLQYVVGWAPFGWLRLRVGPGVFVPRPETEGLADRAAAHLRAAGRASRRGPAGGVRGTPRRGPGNPEGVPRRIGGSPGGSGPNGVPRWNRPPVAVDLCTGSGAIACFLAAEVPGARVLATELDPAALAWARINTDRYGVELLAGDLDAPLPAELAGRVDVLCANVPYVPSGAIPTLPRDVRDHEPRLALDGGPDGLDLLRRVAARAGRWLAPGGVLLCEIGDDQGQAAAALLADAGLAEVAVLPDLVGRDRIVEGRRP